MTVNMLQVLTSIYDTEQFVSDYMQLNLVSTNVRSEVVTIFWMSKFVFHRRIIHIV